MNSADFLTHFHQFPLKTEFWVAAAIHKVAYVSTLIYSLSHSMSIAGSLYAHTSERAYVKHRAENEKVLCKTERKEALLCVCILLTVRVPDKVGGRQ